MNQTTTTVQTWQTDSKSSTDGCVPLSWPAMDGENLLQDSSPSCRAVLRQDAGVVESEPPDRSVTLRLVYNYSTIRLVEEDTWSRIGRHLGRMEAAGMWWCCGEVFLTEESAEYHAVTHLTVVACPCGDWDVNWNRVIDKQISKGCTPLNLPYVYLVDRTNWINMYDKIPAVSVPFFPLCRRIEGGGQPGNPGLQNVMQRVAKYLRLLGYQTESFEEATLSLKNNHKDKELFIYSRIENMIKKERNIPFRDLSSALEQLEESVTNATTASTDTEGTAGTGTEGTTNTLGTTNTSGTTKTSGTSKTSGTVRHSCDDQSLLISRPVDSSVAACLYEESLQQTTPRATDSQELELQQPRITSSDVSVQTVDDVDLKIVDLKIMYAWAKSKRHQASLHQQHLDRVVQSLERLITLGL